MHYLKGLRKRYNVEQWLKCRQQNLYPQCHVQLHLEVKSASIHLIVTDLIGMCKPLPQGH